MNLNELGAGTAPIDPIELPIDTPLPIGCGCTWQTHPSLKRKAIKFLYRDCPIKAHVEAFMESQMSTPVLVVKEEKRPRGRPKKMASLRDKLFPQK